MSVESAIVPKKKLLMLRLAFSAFDKLCGSPLGNHLWKWKYFKYSVFFFTEHGANWKSQSLQYREKSLYLIGGNKCPPVISVPPRIFEIIFIIFWTKKCKTFNFLKHSQNWFRQCYGNIQRNSTYLVAKNIFFRWYIVRKCSFLVF